MLESTNSKKQGDIGLGSAIGWFTSNQYTVSIPLTDSQDYDLIVEKNNKLYRVQVKTTAQIRKGCYVATLRVCGGNRSGKGKTKLFDNTKVELVFILTEENNKYLIPSNQIEAKNAINLYKGRDKYKIT